MAPDEAVEWLLGHEEPAIRYLVRRDVLAEDAPYDGAEILSGRWVSGLLRGQQDDGGFGTHPYRKWTGAFWRVASLAELAAPGDDPRVRAALDHVLDYLTSPRRARLNVVDGLVRRCASLEGLGLSTACRLGHADDPRAEQMARSLVAWQWPDGGWNCDVNASGRRSSFHETHSPLEGLALYADATGAAWARRSADAAAELLLSHHVVRPLGRPDDVIAPAWLRPRFPAYWHFDLLRGLVVLARAAHVTDRRARDALELLESQRAADGRVPAIGSWWRSAASAGPAPEVVDWGRGRENAMVTLQSLVVRRAAVEAGRLALR